MKHGKDFLVFNLLWTKWSSLLVIVIEIILRALNNIILNFS